MKFNYELERERLSATQFGFSGKFSDFMESLKREMVREESEEYFLMYFEGDYQRIYKINNN